MKLSHSPHLTQCVFACMPSGQWAWGWGLSGVSELLNHLPITVYLFFLFVATQQLSPSVRPLNSTPFLFFVFLPPSRRICWGTYRTERGYGSLISIYPKWPGSKKKEEEKEDPVQTRTCDLHASLYDSAQPKESACEAYLSCAAGSDQINWGLFVCMCACVCVWVNISVKAQRYKPNITQWHVFTSRKTWLKTSQACWSYDAALRSLEGGKSWFTDKKRFLLMRFLFFSSLRFELFFSMHVH